MAIKIGVISLGCSKNRVDTEVMLGLLAQEGYEFVQNLEEADIALINTCAFINSAKEESINMVLEAEQQKRFGHLHGIVVTGCLPQRYQGELTDLLPRVDCFLGVAAYKDISNAIKDTLQGKRTNHYAEIDVAQEFEKRIVTTQKPMAYIKIAEGCDNCCSYCVIPQIRGHYQSRKMEDILSEIEKLAHDGYSEFVLVAQDTTNYGTDVYERPMLAELLDKAAQIEGVHWLRVLYSYPDGITDELLQVMVRHDNIVNYIDMPVQHLDDTILKAMNRRTTFDMIKDAVGRIRAASEDFVIRTTLIVGFPGETRKESFLMGTRMKELEFDHVGIFAYSEEEGTAAAGFAEQVDENEKEFRRDALLNLQAPVSLKKNRTRVGKTLEVLIEGIDEYSNDYYGRSYAQAPEADGKIIVKTDRELEAGKYYPVLIEDAYNYDCVGKLATEKE